MNRENKQRRPLWPYLFLALFLAAIMGLTASTAMFSAWTNVETTTAEQAAAALDAQIAQLSDQRKYLSISDTGVVHVSRELERPEATPLVALHLAVYDTESDKLTRVRFPFWFVQVKTTDSLNLGTLFALMSKDWGNLDLSVTEEDLMRRGPGLVLDQTREDGDRILLWSE